MKLRDRPVVERPYVLRERTVVSEHLLSAGDVAVAAAMLRSLIAIDRGGPNE